VLRLFLRLFARPLRREPGRTSLTALAVALGVAVVLAIDLAGEAAAGSFRSSVETLAGNADLEIAAPGGVPPRVLGALAALPYPLRFEARLEDYATVVGSGEAVPLLGLDWIAGALELKEASTARAPEGDAVWLSSAFGLAPGERIDLQIQDRTAAYKVAGVFEQKSRAVAMDLALADEALRRGGKLDRILVWVPSGESVDEWTARLKPIAPQATVAPQGARTRENRRMLEAFRWNLRVLSYIALVVGAFLIYNTISVSVVRRRAEIGVLRALGASRGMVLAAFLAEAALFGAIGGAVGLMLGRAMAEGAVGLLGATVESLYVSSKPTSIELTPLSAAIAFAIGVGVAVASALAPALEASRVAPTEAMARGRVDYLSRVHSARDLALAFALAVAATFASQAPPVAGKPVGGYAAALLAIAAGAFAVPALVRAVDRVASAALARIGGVEAMLAMRSLSASLRRTSVLVGALSTAIAMMVSVGIMVGSFRSTVLVWMDNQLEADLYLRPAGAASADRFPTLDPSLADKLAALPTVETVDRFRAYPISYRGLPATFAGAEMKGRAKFVSGSADGLDECDCAVVSEPFANKHGVRVGDTLTLDIAPLRVVGVYYDYASERGYVVVHRETLLKYLPDPAPSNLAVYLKPGANLDDAKRAVERAARGLNVAVFSNRALREEAIAIFDRTFAITYALEAVAVAVAVMGIAGALLALAIDRRRELGLLRFLGAARGQIRKIVLCEAGLLGLLANVAGASLGAALSLILVFVINKQSFGWTIQFHRPVGVLLGALTLVYVATLLAGLYPARVATSLNPIEVVHEE